ncbi:MAG: hypothetical protein KBB83_01185 [Alphaproteobacteria bacterium]|nr:hypothetical protein [Alphaproteobacteria bacterium]
MMNKTLPLAALLLGFVASESALASNLNQDGLANRPAISASLPTTVDPQQKKIEDLLTKINNSSDSNFFEQIKNEYDLYFLYEDGTLSLSTLLKKCQLQGTRECDLQEFRKQLDRNKADNRMRLLDTIQMRELQIRGENFEQVVNQYALQMLEQENHSRTLAPALLLHGNDHLTTEELRRQAAAANAELQKANAQYRYN